MNGFDFALKMELDGERYYKNLAETVKYDELKKVLEDLAEDEQRHYRIIELAKNQTLEQIKDNPYLTKVQNVFTITANIKSVEDHKDRIEKLKDEQSDVYRAALLKEKESVALYKKLTEDANTPEEKIIFAKLMHEEEKHVEVIDNIIEMLNHVNDWVEAAEFNHQDTY